MNPRLLLFALVILVTFVGAFGTFLWGFLAGFRAALGALLRVWIALMLALIVLGLILFKRSR
ncbi:MAG: hypothetical protein RQ798_00635 [Candidatus Caldarchaeales archaeon]|nr:hypothetical protein [Candidatus Caldarchaeales archaeon]MDT7915019.1 hypothetical protein [Candidatus Caldarchaeales archaeon]